MDLTLRTQFTRASIFVLNNRKSGPW